MDALLIIDVQNDFLPGGALPVPNGDQVIPVINAIQHKFDLVLATQDWHPQNHGSFAANHSNRAPGDVIELNGIPQVLWPVHCVQETFGADFSANLLTEHFAKIFRKGTDPGIDSYSGFFDNGKKRSTGLADYLHASAVDRVFLCGLATDYCVKFSALDSAEAGFKTILIADACRGVDLQPGDSATAIEAMRRAGAAIVDSDDL
ncbi:MAG TPA: bifunctional nicotinamidase/pyrazinamidase [Chthoniobacterales bacterium]|nr:bifunctional nicotinamidase/pyrazinamidase [Chthoniobacterales bacterium]